MTPNQEEKCFQKAFTESREPLWHQIYSGISYSGEEEGEEVEEDGWETWRMSAGGEEGRWWGGRRELFFPSHPISPSLHLTTSVQLCSTCGWGQDGTSWGVLERGGGQHAKLNSPHQQKKPHTIKLRHVLSLNTITWPLRVDNPLKSDQRKSEFWSGLQNVFACRKESIRAAVYMTAACNPVRECSAPLLAAWREKKLKRHR